MTSVALAVNKMFHADSSCTHASDPVGNDWNGFVCLCGDYSMCDIIVSCSSARCIVGLFTHLWIMHVSVFHIETVFQKG